MSSATRDWRAWINGAALAIAALSVASCGNDAPGMPIVPTATGASTSPLPSGGTLAPAESSAAGSGGATRRAGMGGMAAAAGKAGETPGAAGQAAIAGVGGMGGTTAGTAGMATMVQAGAAGMAIGTAGQGSMMMPMVTGPAPTLPAMMGECPQFKNDTTIMIAGHKGIAISAGAPGEGGALLFYWHGTGQSPAEAMRTLPAAVRMEIASTGGIIAAFDGGRSSGSKGDCSGGSSVHNIADFDAADAIAACAVKNHGVDPRRIYTTGCSAGGLQAGCMAQLRSSYVAVSAPNSGGIVRAQTTWQDMHTPAIFTMHGGTSDMVLIYFSDSSKLLDMNAKTHGGFVVNCNHGGDHCKAPPELHTAAWQFMKDHPWGVADSPWRTSMPAGVPSYCKVF